MAKTISMTIKEQKFIDYCMSVPLDDYYKHIRNRCKNIKSDHWINTYQRLADWVYTLRKEQAY